MSRQDPCLICLSETKGRWGSLYFCSFPLLVWGFGCLWWVGSEFLGVSIAGEKFPAGQSSFLSEFILAAEVSRALPSPLSVLIRSSGLACCRGTQLPGLCPALPPSPWAGVLCGNPILCLLLGKIPVSWNWPPPPPPPTHTFLFICLWSFQLIFLRELKACA